MAYLTRLRRSYGTVACLVDQDHPALYTRPGPRAARTVFAFGPECNKQIFTQAHVFQTRSPRGPDHSTFHRLSSNLLFMNGDKHRQQRRLLNPAFTRENLKAHHHDIIRYTGQTVERWQQGRTIDLLKEMNLLTRSIASKVFFGLEPGGNSGRLSRTMGEMVAALFSPVTMIPVDLPGTPFRKLRRDMEEVERLLAAAIEQKRRDGAGSDDVLAMMIRAHDEDGTRLTDAELVSQAFVMFFAGHDTSASSLTMTLFLLAQHPEIVAELHDELDGRLKGAPPSYEQIYDLPVLDRVIKESLRLLGPAVVFPRVAVEPAVLGPYEIPAGCEVLYSSYVTHRDPDLYPEPQRFLPNRWLQINPSLFDYVPFGGGARRCLGASFGGMLLRTVVATLVQHRRLEVIPGASIGVNVNVVMSPTCMPMRVWRQDRLFHRSKAEVRGFIREMVDFG